MSVQSRSRARQPRSVLAPDIDASVSREDFLAMVRNYRSVLKTSQINLRRKGSLGRQFVRSYTRMVDATVGVLFQRAVDEQQRSIDDVDMAIIGAGGYGRAELAPYSDVDIVILCRRKTALVKRITSAFIQLMWDVGFEVGHSVHSLADSEKTLARHMDTRTALFESRFVCGSSKIAREVDRQISRLKSKDREAFLVRKIKDAVTRHTKYGNSFQLIEPNVKLSPGGLRDFQTLVWLGMLRKSDEGLPVLRKKGLLLPGEVKVLEAAYDFLLRVRVETHLITESKQDQLTVGIQKDIAEPLGYAPGGGHLAVERFMRDYYHHTRTIFRITEDIIEVLQYGGNLGVLLGGRKVPATSLQLSVRVSRSRIQKDPLYVFARQKETGLRLDRATRRRLEANLKENLSGRHMLSLMRRQFPLLMSDGRNVALLLRSMHETGFLGAIIPEYDELTSLKRYDLYHHYTVDEHSFQVVQNLESLRTPSARRIDPLTRLYSEVSDKQVLLLAALLHDIGKIQGRGHAKKGSLLSRKILKRMSLQNEVVDAVSFLVEVHLLMSHYSQRRDPTDLATLEAFCKRVGSRPVLKHLCLLTFADLKATSPEVWTQWKRSLLWALYLKSYEYMANREKAPEEVYKSHKKKLLKAFAAGRERQAALEHIDMLPGRYLLTMNAGSVRRHMELVAELKGKRAVVDFESGEQSADLTFCMADKPFRLSHLCGVLTMNDCNILFACAFTRSDGNVIDVFRVADISGHNPIDESRVEKIRTDLDAVLRDRLDVPEEVEKHIRKWKRTHTGAIPVPLKIEFDNDLSPDVTIIDIFARDQPGLLFKITRALSEEGLTIHRASISTEANRAIDSFDVQDSRGGKITKTAKLRSVRARLARTLG